jgi:hypothetical protein
MLESTSALISPTAPPPAPARPQLQLWDQCGGISSAAGKDAAIGAGACCAAGSTCNRVNEWYWQCQPSASLPSSGLGGSGQGTLELWAQCGGKGGNCASSSCADGPYPAQTCPAGSSCQRESEW